MSLRYRLARSGLSRFAYGKRKSMSQVYNNENFEQEQRVESPVLTDSEVEIIGTHQPSEWVSKEEDLLNKTVRSDQSELLEETVVYGEEEGGEEEVEETYTEDNVTAIHGVDPMAPNAPKKKKTVQRKRPVSPICEPSPAPEKKKRVGRLYVMTAENYYRPNPDEYVGIGEPNIFATVKVFKKDIYVCIRAYHFSQVDLCWIASKTGLNLTLDEWARICRPRMQGLVADAIAQLDQHRGPIQKLTMEEELLSPTSYPELIKENVYQHRHDLSLAKKIVVSTSYAPDNEIRVSLLQFDSTGLEEVFTPKKGIHLPVYMWQNLCKEIDTINQRVQELKKKNNDR